jgi:hypothetical protein
VVRTFDIKYLRKNPDIFKEFEKFIKKGDKIELNIDTYQMVFSRSKFLVFKNEKLILKNCLISWEYNSDTGNLILNPETDKKVIINFYIYPYKHLKSFLLDYYFIIFNKKSFNKDCAKEISGLLMFFKSTLGILIYFVVLFGTMVFLMYVTLKIKIFDKHDTLAIWLSMFFALLIAEIIWPFIEERLFK